MPNRDTPYGAFNFLVDIGDRDATKPLGGFAEVNGLGVELTIAEYRDGNEAENHVRKVPGIHKVSDVTLKRGVVDSSDLWAWIDDARRNGHRAKRNITVTLLDEDHTTSVIQWKLIGALPMKYTGPQLQAKGGTDVAMEELVLAADGIEFQQIVAATR